MRDDGAEDQGQLSRLGSQRKIRHLGILLVEHGIADRLGKAPIGDHRRLSSL